MKWQHRPRQRPCSHKTSKEEARRRGVYNKLRSEDKKKRIDKSSKIQEEARKRSEERTEEEEEKQEEAKREGRRRGKKKTPPGEAWVRNEEESNEDEKSGSTGRGKSRAVAPRNKK